MCWTGIVIEPCGFLATAYQAEASHDQNVNVIRRLPFTSPLDTQHLQCADGSGLLHQHSAQEPLQPPSQTPSESPSLSPQPPQATLTSTIAAGPGPPLSAAISSASQPLSHNNPTEGQVAASQKSMQEQRPQLWPLSGGALAAAAGLQATGQNVPALQPKRKGLFKFASFA